MSNTLLSSTTRVLQRQRLPESSSICRRCLQQPIPSSYRSLTTVSHTLDTEEPLIPTKLAHSLGYRTGPQSKNDFIKIANERRAALKTQQPSKAAPPNPRQAPASFRGKRESHLFQRLPQKKTPPTSSVAPRHAVEQPSTTTDSSLQELLPFLRSQPPFYAQVLIHGKPYLVTLGDKIQLPFLMHGVSPGDILRLDRISLIGSRDYTLKAGPDSSSPHKAIISQGPPSDAEMNSHGEVIGHSGAIAASKAESSIHHGTAKALPTLPGSLYTIRATVLGVETEPMRVMEKTKRRQRHIRRIRSKHRYTVLGVSELRVHGVEEMQAESVASGGNKDPTMQEQLHEGEGEVREVKETAEVDGETEKVPSGVNGEPARPEEIEDQLHKTGP